jgi:hypothetical protein
MKSGRNKGKNKCKTRKGLEDQHPVVGPGLAGALGSLLKVGKRTGVSEGVFDAIREWTGKGWGKKNAVKLRGGYGRGVPVYLQATGKI